MYPGDARRLDFDLEVPLEAFVPTDALDDFELRRLLPPYSAASFSSGAATMREPSVCIHANTSSLKFGEARVFEGLLEGLRERGGPTEFDHGRSGVGGLGDCGLFEL